MSKQLRQTPRDAKIAALDTFTSLLKQEPTKDRIKTRFVSKQKLASDANVKERYESYALAVKLFNKARNDLMRTKIRLQRILDTPFVQARKISQSQFWDFKLDENGNMLFKDDTQSYVERYKNFKHQMKIERNYEDDDIKFDWTKEDAAQDRSEVVKSTAEGTLEGTSYISPFTNGSTFTDNAQLFLETYREILTIEDRYEFYRRELAADEENVFFTMLNDEERASLYPHLDDEEKARIISPNRPPEISTTKRRQKA